MNVNWVISVSIRINIWNLFYKNLLFFIAWNFYFLVEKPFDIFCAGFHIGNKCNKVIKVLDLEIFEWKLILIYGSAARYYRKINSLINFSRFSGFLVGWKGCQNKMLKFLSWIKFFKPKFSSPLYVIFAN